MTFDPNRFREIHEALDRRYPPLPPPVGVWRRRRRWRRQSRVEATVVTVLCGAIGAMLWMGALP